jgi:hypothetical protein
MDSESSLAAGGWIVSLVEIVDILLHAHGFLRRQIAIADVAAHDGVGAGVHIDSESGQVIVLGIDEGVDTIVLEKDGIIRFIVGRGLSACGRRDRLSNCSRCRYRCRSLILDDYFLSCLLYDLRDHDLFLNHLWLGCGATAYQQGGDRETRD